ncbi:MAG: DegT/DnrJ/EryC1/StrS family aminotransferase [Caldilinea sp.]|nr:DegT/DnrJ/EryC1/StrS family aminotransferase [Caldilinea sp.]
MTLPVAEAASERVLSLPVHPALSEAELAQVVGVLRATSVAPVSV